MKKRGFIIFLLLTVLLIPSASAIIELGSTISGKYNLGDTVNIDGKLLSTTDISGIFTIELTCGSVSFPLITKIVDLEANEEQFFSEKLSFSKKLSSPGDCHFTVGIKGIEEKTTSTINVTKELQGDFKIDNNIVQLGQSVKLTGKVLRLNQINADGSATIYIKKGDETIFVPPIPLEVSSGEIVYTYKAESIPQGDYSIDLDVLDKYGNEMYFKNIAKFEVSGEIAIDLKLDKVEVLPGEDVKLSGIIKYKKTSDSSNIEVKVGEDTAAVSPNGDFTYTYFTGKTSKSADYTLNVIAQDKSGNYGEKSFTYKITPVATSINLYIPQEEFLPGEKTSMAATISDQAGDKMAGGALIEIYDSKGEVIATGTSTLDYAIPEFTAPGIMKVKASGEGLIKEDEFSIGEKKEFEATVDNTTLYIKNTGNVKFDGEAEIITGDESSFEKVRIGINEVKAINLQDKAGTYNLKVLVGGKEVSLGEVTIIDKRSVFSKLASPLTGNVVGTGDSGGVLLGYLIVILILVIFVAGYYFTKVKDRDRSELIRERERREAKKFKESLQQQKMQTTGKRSFGREINPEEARQFREQFIKSANTNQQRNKPRSIF
ncbi:hypothetical protein HYT57_00355 [Candidatus Woesearchaeota archaeon]|nr:hypothetical protein [Candidatus Woesearchaeota archaeon]